MLILSKAFKLNKLLLLDELLDEPQTGTSPRESSVSEDRERPSVCDPMESSQVLFDYDADIEMNLPETDTERRRFDLSGFTTHASFRADLILFPKLLEICLDFVLEQTNDGGKSKAKGVGLR